MIIRDLAAARATSRHVVSEGWQSLRLLLKEDGMGFSFHITIVAADAELAMRYANHLESVFCISGEGTLQDVVSGTTHPIRPGVLYALDRNDRHVLKAGTELVLACVFNPPLNGRETHDETGSYPLEAEPANQGEQR